MSSFSFSARYVQVNSNIVSLDSLFAMFFRSNQEVVSLLSVNLAIATKSMYNAVHLVQKGVYAGVRWTPNVLGYVWLFCVAQ